MPTERNRKVRERAYGLWVAGGHQDGRSDEHWAQAEREIDAEETPLRTAAGDKAAAKAGSKLEAAATKPVPPTKSSVSAKAAAGGKQHGSAVRGRGTAPKSNGAGAAKH